MDIAPSKEDYFTKVMLHQPDDQEWLLFGGQYGRFQLTYAGFKNILKDEWLTDEILEFFTIYRFQKRCEEVDFFTSNEVQICMKEVMGNRKSSVPLFAKTRNSRK